MKLISQWTVKSIASHGMLLWLLSFVPILCYYFHRVKTVIFFKFEIVNSSVEDILRFSIN